MKLERRRLRLAAACALALAGGWTAASAGAAEEVVGRVAAVRGTATAQAPGEKLRVLHCDDPIHRGDRIETAEGSEVGIVAGVFHAGLGAETALDFETTPAGSPDLRLAAGRLRLMRGGRAAPARIATPGLLAARADADTEAFAFPEKSWVISMLCPRAGGLEATRASDPSQSISAGAGQCAIEKPREKLYLAPASHPRLAVLDQGCGELPLAGVAADRFVEPTPPVALAGAPPAYPEVAALQRDVRLTCDVGCGAIPGSGEVPFEVVIPPSPPAPPPPGAP
jgi:hypothetical protein